MGSPPQGLIANALVAGVATGAFQIKIDSGGNLGVFNDLGTEIFKFGTSANGILGVPSIAYDVQLLGATSLRLSSGTIRKDAILTVGKGLAPIYGLDNRSGITAADGAPITLYAVPTGADQLFDAAIEIDATAFTSGTATYTMTYTENAVTQTIVVTATVLNVVTGVRRLIQPDASTNITVQLTGVFTATVRLSAAVMQLA